MDEKRISRKELTKQNLKKNKKRKNIKTLIIIAITAVMVYITGIYGASLAYFGDFISSGLTLVQIGRGFPIEDDFSSALQSQKMGTALCVLTPDYLNIYSPTGKKIFTYSHAMQNPVISTSKNRAIIYDLNGTTLKVANGHNILFQQEMPNNIIHADISNSNRIAVTTRSSSYNGEVSVFNYNMKQRFVWYCATGYPIYSTLSNSGDRLAVNTVQTEGGLLKCDIYVIDASKGKELFSISCSDYPVKIEFLNDDKLLIAYTNKLVMYSIPKNSEILRYEFGDAGIQALHTSGNYITVAYGGASSDQSSKIAMLSQDFTEKFVVEVPEKIKSLSVSQSRIFALGYNNLYEYDYSANLVNTVSAGPLYKQLVDYNGTLLISSTSIQKVEKTKSR